MRLPLSWLKEYLKKLPATPALVDRLVMHGLEVEEVIDRRQLFDRIVVGQIVKISPHPGADKLRLASVILSSDGRPQEIVCGAPNIIVGQKVPVALVGAKLANGLTIESRPIRGVVSNGMLCAEDELGLGTNHSGIVILDNDIPPGTPLAAALGASEPVLDLSIPANRPDLMSVRGLVREIGAIFGQTVKFPATKLLTTKGAVIKAIKVQIAEPKLCPLYSAQVIRGITIKTSPVWLQNRLRAAGLRPINAVVDATNYIMLEYGQPLHAFDATKVTKQTIIVRPAKAGEELTTLDNQRRKLKPSMLVIADSVGPIALAGVMGGANSEINPTTTDIVLEAAIFDPVSVRRTARQLGLISEASKRFEKGLSLSLPEQASQAATQLISELCGGKVEGGSVVVGSRNQKPIIITFKPQMLTDLMGMKVAPATAKQILSRLGFKLTGTTTWKVTVPEWRLDVAIPEDVVDEIGRLIGYEQLPDKLPLIDTIPQAIPTAIQIKDEIRDLLVNMGFSEIITHAYYGQTERQIVGQPHIQIANPLDKSQQFLRRTIMPRMRIALEAVTDAGEDGKIFEIGRVFRPELSAKVEQQQPWKITLGLAKKMTHRVPSVWPLLGVVHNLEQYFGLTRTSIEAIHTMTVKGRLLVWAELDLHQIIQYRRNTSYQAHPSMPPVTRDISLWLPPQMTYATLRQALISAGQPLLQEVWAIDAIEENEKIGLTIRLEFIAPNRTLVKDEVDRVMSKCVNALHRINTIVRK